MGRLRLVLFVVSYCILFELSSAESNIIFSSFLKQRLQRPKANNCFPDGDVCRNASELITSKGYTCEEHTVQTDDGYLLGLQRIPSGRKSIPMANPKPVVLLQHGLLSSSADWVVNLANESLAFLLADAGFDVWLSNMRGNTYSRRHVKYSPTQDQFWSFSWDEMAQYDFPAIIDYVLKESNQDQLHYVGHSQGTLVAFAQLSQDQRYTKKIKSFFALGPVATVGHLQGPLRTLAYITPELKELFYIFGIHEFLPQSDLMKLIGETLCFNSWTREACENVIFLICGYDETNLNKTRLPVYVTHDPAGTSVQNVVHFAQMVRSGKFQMYDYGCPEKNRRRYGQDTPPEYNSSAVQVPVYLISAEKDRLSDPKDVDFLRRNLPNIVKSIEIPDWEHLDFLWAMNAPATLYYPIINVLKRLES